MTGPSGGCSRGLTLIVLFAGSTDEHDALYETVFLPAVEALVPLE